MSTQIVTTISSSATQLSIMRLKLKKVKTHRPIINKASCDVALRALFTIIFPVLP